MQKRATSPLPVSLVWGQERHGRTRCRSGILVCFFEKTGLKELENYYWQHINGLTQSCNHMLVLHQS
jgi:hypothetical protein